MTSSRITPDGWLQTTPATRSIVTPDGWLQEAAIIPPSTPLSGSVGASVTGAADLKLGTALSGDVTPSITGTADLSTGTHLAAIGRIEATPRGRLSGAAATPSAGNFFLLF